MSRAQIRTPSHQLVEASFVPSGLKLTPSTAHPEPRRTSCSAPVSASNSRTVRSALAVATRDPSGPEGDIGDAPRLPFQHGYGCTALHAPDLHRSSRTGRRDTGTDRIEVQGHAFASIVRTTSPRAQSQILTWLLPCS